MCGIAGVLGRGADVSDEHVERMIAALGHRGPDDRGVWADAWHGVGIGQARLSIVDLSQAGHQPMCSATGRYSIVFNGEIYNHQGMREALHREGAAPSWRGHADTETLLAGFDAWGIEATTKKSVGMFAFAVWDAHTKVLTLARDRLGEKPLYYGWAGQTLLFGSELKALLAHPACEVRVDRNALVAFMRYGYVPAPQSIYEGIYKLPPATLLHLSRSRRDEAEPVAYWSLLDVAREGMRSPFEGSDDEALELLGARLSEAVSLQQMSDVPLGAFLSGGVDSSTIVALMQAQSARPVHTFTIGFETTQIDEAVYAKAVARHLGTDHTELYVTAKQAQAVIPRLPRLYDEPFGDSSQIPTFLVSQLARQQVTVSLSGDGGDELFGGYNRHGWARRANRVPMWLRRVGETGLRALSPQQWDRVYEAIRPVLPSALQLRMPGHKAHKLADVLEVQSEAELYQRLVSIWSNPADVVVGGADAADQHKAWNALADFTSIEAAMMALDTLGYLPDDILCKVDRAAMGCSLETRVPFLDHRVVALAWQMPLHMKIRNGQGKWILRQLLDRHVPRALIERPKMGFAVPIGTWLRGPLRDWGEELLSESRLRREGYLEPGVIRERWAEHLSGRLDCQYPLWNVLMFQAWLSEWA
jgi:asparagine synthase (glutamine-hydrolysing)